MAAKLTETTLNLRASLKNQFLAGNFEESADCFVKRPYCDLCLARTVSAKAYHVQNGKDGSLCVHACTGCLRAIGILW